MRISTSKSKTMVLSQKRVGCLLQVVNEVLPQVEEFKYLRVLFTNDGRREWEIDRLVQRLLSVVMKGELSQKVKALFLLVDLCSNPHLWSRTVGSDQKNKIADTSG